MTDSQTIQTRRVRIVHAKDEAAGTVQIQTFTDKERLVRTVKFVGVCWLAAVVAVAIPLLHFVLVPGLFLAGIIGGFLKYATQSLVLGGGGTCPRCKAALPIVKGPNRWPITELCTSCRTNSEVYLEE